LEEKTRQKIYRSKFIVRLKHISIYLYILFLLY